MTGDPISADARLPARAGQPARPRRAGRRRGRRRWRAHRPELADRGAGHPSADPPGRRRVRGGGLAPDHGAAPPRSGPAATGSRAPPPSSRSASPVWHEPRLAGPAARSHSGSGRSYNRGDGGAAGRGAGAADRTRPSTRSASTRSVACWPRPAGRVASPGTGPSTWSGSSGSASCRAAGFSLAVIRRLLDGELDADRRAARRRGGGRGRRGAAHPRRARGAGGRPVGAARRRGPRGTRSCPAPRDGEARFAASDGELVVTAGLRAPRGRAPAPELLDARPSSSRRHPGHRRGGGASSSTRTSASRCAPAAELERRRRPNGSSTRSDAPARRHDARRAPLPERAARGGPGAPRGGRRAGRARRGPRRARLEPGGRGGRRMTALGAARRAAPRARTKRDAVESMFDRIAPTYDRMNRAHLAGPRPRLATPGRRALGGRTGARVLDLGCGTGDLCRELGRRRAPRPIGAGPLGGDARRGAHRRAARRAPTPRRLPFADAEPRRDRHRVRAPQRRRPRHGAPRVRASVLRTRRALRRARRRRAGAARLRIGNAVWFRGAVPLLGRLLSPATPTPTATCPARSPTCRRPSS